MEFCCPSCLKYFSVYAINGLRILVLLFHFFSSLMAASLYSYSLSLILTFLCSFTITSFSPMLKSPFFWDSCKRFVQSFAFILALTLLFSLSSCNCCSSCTSPLSSRSCFFGLSNLYSFVVVFRAMHIFLLLPFFSLLLSHSCMTLFMLPIYLFISSVRQHTVSNLHFPFIIFFLFCDSPVLSLLLLICMFVPVLRCIRFLYFYC